MDRIDELEVFIAILEAGSLSGAARRLRRSPPSVTRSLAALEERVGARLLYRSTREVSLTDAGQAYLAPCAATVATRSSATTCSPISSSGSISSENGAKLD